MRAEWVSDAPTLMHMGSMFCEHKPPRWNPNPKKGTKSAKGPASHTAKAKKAASSKGPATAILNRPAKSSEAKLA
eukprot:12893506-Alexandrium_andersonii.AAC.1